jgi:hypothetical protein
MLTRMHTAKLKDRYLQTLGAPTCWPGSPRAASALNWRRTTLVGRAAPPWLTIERGAELPGETRSYFVTMLT